MLKTHKRLDVHVANACQLSCEGCNHYSNYDIKGIFSCNQLVDWATPWAQRVEFEKIQLVGGEPFLNKELQQICYKYRDLFPVTPILLFTNGLLLSKNLKWLYTTLHDTKIKLIISLHSVTEKNYLDKIKKELYSLEKYGPLTKIEETWFRTVFKLKNIEVDLRKVMAFNTARNKYHWSTTYKGVGKSMKPFQDNNQRQSWENCIVQDSLQLYYYNLWKCPPIAYLSDVLNKFDLSNDKDWKPYLKYNGISANSTTKQIKQFLEAEDEWICKMCPKKPQVLNEKRVYK